MGLTQTYKKELPHKNANMASTLSAKKVIHSNIHTALAINRIPLFGILSFILLYFYSSTLYPGGSQVDLYSQGYDWINNYWCNLMNENGMNGEPNPARFFSIPAMIILCFSLMIFFIQFAEYFSEKKIWQKTIKVGGILSMVFATLMFTKHHDLMTIISSFFGLFVVVGIIRQVYISNLKEFQYSGIICLALLGVNNFIYYSNSFIEWLPLIQKITFLIVLIWIIGLNNEVRKKIRVD